MYTGYHPMAMITIKFVTTGITTVITSSVISTIFQTCTTDKYTFGAMRRCYVAGIMHYMLSAVVINIMHTVSAF